MKTTAPFILIVIGYIAFEGYVASRNAYRMEPEHIFGQYVSASHAVARCGTLKPVDAAKFDANYRYARRRAVAATAESVPDESRADIEAMVASEELAGRQTVDDLVSERGCADIELFRLRKGYENLARLNLPTTQADRGN